MLHLTGQGNGLSPTLVTPIAQPVAQTPAPAAGMSGAGRGRHSGSSPSVATPIAQPVAQMVDVAEQVWPKTFAALKSYFPMVGVPFLARLAAAVRNVAPHADDTAVAAAVEVAWKSKKQVQRTEGLFLYTVPAALRAGLADPAPAAAAVQPDGVTALVAAVIIAVRKRPALASKFLARLEDLESWIHSGADLFDVAVRMEGLEDEIMRAADASLDAAERAAVETRVSSLAAQAAPASSRMNGVHRENLRLQIWGREVLAVLGIPRLSALYA